MARPTWGISYPVNDAKLWCGLQVRRGTMYTTWFSRKDTNFRLSSTFFFHTIYVRAPYYPAIIAYERQQSFYRPRDIYRSYLFTTELSAYHLVPSLNFNDTPRLRTSRTAVDFRVPIGSVTIGFSSYATKPTRKKRLDFGTIDPRSVSSLDNEIQHAHRGQNCNPSREQAYTS